MLVVCTGNICRSPAAELLLRHRLGPGSGIGVASAGIHALAGAPVAEPMAALLRERGIAVDGWTARQLDPDEVRRSAVVLTMTGDQRSAVVRRAPGAVRRAFTLQEFADIARLSPGEPGTGPAERLAALVTAAPIARAQRTSDGDDIEDPYRREAAVFERVLARIETAVDAVVAALVPEPAHSA